MCMEVGVKCEFLPLYSPDFNPIEESFAELKQWIKKNRSLEADYESFEQFLTLGLDYMGRIAGNHCRCARISEDI
jgi:transposase